MRYDEFIGQVQNRARLSSRGQAERAAEATLCTLAERLAGEEGEHIVAQLPEELARLLRQSSSGGGESFSFDELEVWREAVSQGQVDHVLAQLTDDYRPLFESGSQGQMR